MSYTKRLLDSRVLRKLRDNYGFTNQSLFERSGVPVKTLERWMKRNCGYTAENLNCVLEAINDRRSEMKEPPITLEGVLEREPSNLTIADCLPEFIAWQQHCPGNTLTLRVLAIDLSYAWENFLRVLTSPKVLATEVHVQLLMLSDDVDTSNADPCVRETVNAWCLAAKGYHSVALLGVKSYHGAKAVDLAIRRYSAVPEWHGIAAEIGFGVRHYITRCYVRDDGVPEYAWGEREYVVVSADDQTEQVREYRAEFDARFSQLWEEAVGSEELATSPTPAH